MNTDCVSSSPPLNTAWADRSSGCRPVCGARRWGCSESTGAPLPLESPTEIDEEIDVFNLTARYDETLFRYNEKVTLLPQPSHWLTSHSPSNWHQVILFYQLLVLVGVGLIISRWHHSLRRGAVRDSAAPKWNIMEAHEWECSGNAVHQDNCDTSCFLTSAFLLLQLNITIINKTSRWPRATWKKTAAATFQVRQ